MKRQVPNTSSWVLAAGIAALFATSARATDESPGRPPGVYEDQAVEMGRKLGIGSATLEGPKQAEVMSHGTWTIVYAAGRAGVKRGGGLRIAMRHVHQWSPPQNTDPKNEGYLTAAGPEGARLRVSIHNDWTRFFRQYFPWQHVVEVILPDRGLRPGETLRVTYGDRRGGSPGMRVQPFDENRFVLKVFVDAGGNGNWLPLPDTEQPALEVVAAAPHRLNVVMPSDAVVGQPTWCLVRAEDRYGNPAPSYCACVRLQSDDPAARLPDPHRFAPSDGGVFRFEPVVFATPGEQRVTATDGQFQATGNPVRVAGAPPQHLLLWGDLHGHTLFSDGRGTVEEYYDFAENVAGLDFAAVSDHDFQLLDWMWKHSKAVTNRVNRPGKFVAFQAFEWSGETPLGGDHNVYFLEDDPPLWRCHSYYDPKNLQMDHGPAPKAKHIQEVFDQLAARLREKNVLCIPHWGGRHGNPAFHQPGVQRLIEIFSEHRRSEDWARTFLDRGHRAGIMASGDDHYGNPGHGYLMPTYRWDTQEIGMAAVAVYAKERTRESIFRALYDRHCYATSGDRIRLDFRADGHPMGSEYRTDRPPRLEVEAVGTAPITRLQIVKDGKIARSQEPGTQQLRFRWQDPQFDRSRTSYYYVRVVQVDREEAISSPVWVN